MTHFDLSKSYVKQALICNRYDSQVIVRLFDVGSMESLQNEWNLQQRCIQQGNNHSKKGEEEEKKWLEKRERGEIEGRQGRESGQQANVNNCLSTVLQFQLQPYK